MSFFTPTYRRPQQLASCLASVSAQTIADDLEQIVIPDHVGRGVGGMFAQVPRYTDAVHGEYVHFLADDDVLASPTVAEQVRTIARTQGYPAVVLVNTIKGGLQWPQGQPWPPVCGAIDLGCFIVRADVWKAHAKDYGHFYEGDYAFAKAVCEAGHQALYVDLLFSTGAVSRGAPEVAA